MTFQQLKTAVVAALAANLLAACGLQSAPASQTDSMLGVKTSTVQLLPTGVRSTTLPAGEYVVSFVRTEPCQSHELNLKKALKLAVPAGELPQVLVSATGDVQDNLAHAEICFTTPAPSKGSLVLTLDRPTKVVATDALLLSSVERVTAKEALPSVEASTTLAAGRYVVQLAGTAACRPEELNVAKSLHYAADRALTIDLAASGVVADDLLRAQICLPESPATATAFLAVSQPAQLATTGAGDLHVAAVSRVTATEAVALR